MENNENIPKENAQTPEKKHNASEIWNRILWSGLGEKVQRAATVLVSLLLAVSVFFIISRYYLNDKLRDLNSNEATEHTQVFSADARLPYFDPSYPDNEKADLNRGIRIYSKNHTELPAKPRGEVIKYTVEESDTLTGIAEKFSLKTSTILWGNPYTLSDDPHQLRIGMELNILPVDGVYYEWHDGDGLNGVSDVYGVKPEDIIGCEANHLSPETIGDYSKPNIKTGTWLVIPGGSREFMNWSAPIITRENPAVASIYGPGHCEAVTDGPVGSGVFIWPTTETWLSGYNYDEGTNHRAIDIAGQIGNAVYAADAGVVVYAGWNDHGYGNVVMIDHGNGWQTLYAHLDSYNVGCGYYVSGGDVIGGLGTTGNSSGPHLHYEMRYNGVPMNPNNFY